MRKHLSALAALGLVLAIGPAATGAGGPPQGTQTDGAFAASYAGSGVSNVSATTQKVSCYRPEVDYTAALAPEQGYPGGGTTACPGATTGEDQGPFATQDVTNPSRLVKDHSESDIRVDPRPGHQNHLIGQSKWFVNAEGYNHLLGFYESIDGGTTWSVQGHVPGYEGWTDNTDPVGAFDPYGNFYSLILGYSFRYDKAGNHKYDNGSNQTNPTVPPEVVAVSIRPHDATTANQWDSTNGGAVQHDYLMTAKNANTSDPDKQWIAIDDNPGSPCKGTIYAMWTVFVLNPSVVFVSTATALPNGTHTPWSAPRVLPTVNGKRWDSYLLPHIAPDGTVYTPVTNGPPQQGFSNADVTLVSSGDCGTSWTAPQPIVSGISVPTYQNTTFREGIVDTFGVGSHLVGNHYPLYLAYEDGSSGVSNVWLTASFDGGGTWSTPMLVNDNATPVDELQPNLTVDAASGKVAVAFYDRRLACPLKDTTAGAGAGLAFDPSASGAANYCVNTAVQFYTSQLAPIGHNIRLSADTWDPQLNAPHPGCICSAGTFIGDYFGIDSNGTDLFTTSVSTYNTGDNPSNYQQQVVARVPIPSP